MTLDFLLIHQIYYEALPDDSNGQESLDTGRFIWQSNNDPVNETIFSGRCAQLNGVSWRRQLHLSRFAYPYLPTCEVDCNKDECGNTLDAGYQPHKKLSRGMSAGSYNYKGQNHGQGGTNRNSGLRFKGYANYPLALHAWVPDGHYSSRLQIYAS